MAEISDRVITLIQEIEDALAIVRQQSQQHLNITLRQADLTLNLITETKTIAGGSVELLVPVKASIERTGIHTQKFELSLTPIGGGLALGEPESNTLAQAILDLATSISKISGRTPALFALTGGSITVAVEINQEGKLQFVAGGSRQASSAHTIKLLFRPS